MIKFKHLFQFIPNTFKKITSFLKSVRIEMGKVRWATFEEMKKYTYVVISIILILVLYFWGLDYVIGLIENLIG